MKYLNAINLLAAAPGVVEAMRIVRIVLIAVMAVCAIAITVLVLLQPSASEGMGAISGQSSYDSFYSKNKVRTPEGIMKRLTVVLSILMVLLAIAFFITYIWSN